MYNWFLKIKVLTSLKAQLATASKISSPNSPPKTESKEENVGESSELATGTLKNYWHFETAGVL